MMQDCNRASLILGIKQINQNREEALKLLISEREVRALQIKLTSKEIQMRLKYCYGQKITCCIRLEDISVEIRWISQESSEAELPIWWPF